MHDRTFAGRSLRRAIATAAAPAVHLAKPIKHTTAMLAASVIGLTSGAAIAAEGAVLEEIIVTATRREASLQDVAIPMTAVSGDALKRKFAQDLRDLTNAAPNVQLEPVGIFQNSASFFIRGQGTGDIESAADSKVAIFVDGVVQGRVSTSMSDMLDVQSVEILRGPQGTLFGRNTVAGAVQILHNEPQMNEWGGSVSVQAGDFGRLDVKGVVNMPMIDDTLAGRIAIKNTHHDGYWKNSFNDKDRGGTDRLTINPSIKWQPNESLDIVVRGEWSETRDDTYMAQSHHYCRNDPFNTFIPGAPNDNDLIVTSEALFNLVILGQDPVTAAANAASICAKPIGTGGSDGEYTETVPEHHGQRANNDVWGITWQADYDLPELGTLTYVGGYREVEEDLIFTLDPANHDFFAGERFQDHDQMSHELRFASNFSDQFDFVAGAYYFEQEYTMKQESWGQLFAPNVLWGTTFTGPLTFANEDTQGQAGFSNQTNSAWALFTQANWHATDSLTLTVGGRYTSEKKKFKHCSIGSGDPSLPLSAAKNAEGCNNAPLYEVDPTRAPLPGAGGLTPQLPLRAAIGFDSSGGVENGCRPVLDPAGAPILCNNRLTPPQEKWTDFTPMAGITYQINDDVMAYFTYTAGFTAGGFNGRGGSASTVGPFEPEKADNYELGIKSDWFDNRLRVNVTAFSTTVDDFQTAFIRPAPGGGGQETVGSNLGSLETEGVELEVSGAPTPGLTLWTNLSYLKTTRKGFCTDPDGAHGTDPINPPTEGGPFSQGLPVCGPAERITDSLGTFQGWLVPNDLADLNPTGRSPEFTASAGFAYEWNLNDLGNLMISADWLHQGKQTIAGSRVNELPGVVQFNGDLISHFRKATDIFNASAIWRSPEARYEAAFFVKNFTNELYVQAVTNVAGLLEVRVPNIRRHWALEFRVNLGNP
ncbi:MAG: TonB-dependent receptor [Gammaproteobacteria bacterium]|nr:TonB-dependent receptor [Gammaproteobacteria bacterium]